MGICFSMSPLQNSSLIFFRARHRSQRWRVIQFLEVNWLKNNQPQPHHYNCHTTDSRPFKEDEHFFNLWTIDWCWKISIAISTMHCLLINVCTFSVHLFASDVLIFFCNFFWRQSSFSSHLFSTRQTHVPLFWVKISLASLDNYRGVLKCMFCSWKFF